jgi:hypothetical protein
MTRQEKTSYNWSNLKNLLLHQAVQQKVAEHPEDESHLANPMLPANLVRHHLTIDSTRTWAVQSNLEQVH